MLVLGMSICGATVFAQNATTEVSKTETKTVVNTGGEVSNSSLTGANSELNIIEQKKLRATKVVVLNDALIKSSEAEAKPKNDNQ